MFWGNGRDRGTDVKIQSIMHPGASMGHNTEIFNVNMREKMESHKVLMKKHFSNMCIYEKPMGVRTRQKFGTFNI